jgi:bacillithiol system protein YtxJ
MKEWKEITSEKDVQEIITASETRPQVIFKHSISCGISAFAKEKLEDGSHLIVAKADFNYLNLLRYRSISNLIASALKITHQSPQVIVLKNKEVVYHSSHHSIDSDKIVEKL